MSKPNDTIPNPHAVRQEAVRRLYFAITKKPEHLGIPTLDAMLRDALEFFFDAAVQVAIQEMERERHG